MKVSLKWIKDYVNLPSDLDLKKLAYDLTMSTVEVEGVVDLASKFDNMVVGIIQEVLPHPDADKLRICKTDIGNGDIKEIVCGGINLEKDMKVAIALPGAFVRWHGEGDLIPITIAKVRGVESYGMICASTEIGLADLFPLTEEAEILDLSRFDVPAGTTIAEALNMNDVVLEIDNKSLTNRPDLWGHYGIAREISALYNLPLKEIESYQPTKTDSFVNIDDSNACPRYIGIKMEGVSVKPSPFEFKRRIWSVGMRPINSIVDITNYVMLATGNPTHAFDSDVIKGNITVRLATADEKLLLLDGRELSLNPKDLVIADDVEAVALAGVMGGAKDSILPETNNVILEIANFEPMKIRRTAANYESRTEAATRYEKGIDPERCDIALSVAMQLFSEFYSDMSVTGFQDNYPKSLDRNEIKVSLDWLEKRLGKKIPNDEIEALLNRLGFDISFNGDIMNVVTPTWRSTGDISIADDIFEEVARMYGFENFEATPISITFTGTINQLDVDLDRKIKEYLAFRCGMQEIFTHPWVNIDYIKAVFGNTDEMLSLSTPPSPNEAYLRSSHIPNLCKVVASNLRYYNEFSIFESAQIFFDKDFKAEYDEKEKLPLQKKNIAGAIVGNPKNIESLFRNAKGIIENLSRYVHIENITFEQNEKPIWADDIVWLNIKHNNECVGNLALLSKKVSLACGIKNSAVVIFEIDIDSLKPLPSRTNEFIDLPEYPMTNYDLSLLVDSAVKWNDILNLITDKSKGENILRDISYLGEYKGPQVPEGKKSITIRLVIGSLQKTLTSDEIDQYVNRIMKQLNKTYGVEIRTQ